MDKTIYGIDDEKDIIKQIEYLKKINPTLIKESGSIKTFQEQLLEYKYGKFPKGIPLVVSPTSKIIGIEKLSDLPITINQSIINKIEEKHGIEVDSIICLEEQLKNHVLAFESMTIGNAIVLVFEQKDNEDRQVICALHQNTQSSHVEVNAIRSIYGRNNISNMICNTYANKKEFFPNKRTDDWLKSVGVQFPKEIINHLSLSLYDSKSKGQSQAVKPKKPMHI